MFKINKKSIWLLILILIFFGKLKVFASPEMIVVDNTLDAKIELSIGEDGLIVLKDGDGEAEANKAWGTLIEKYKDFIIAISGIGAITMVLLFIKQFLKLGASAGNPKARSEALVGVLWTGISASLLGAVSLVTFIFYNATK